MFTMVNLYFSPLPDPLIPDPWLLSGENPALSSPEFPPPSDACPVPPRAACPILALKNNLPGSETRETGSKSPHS